MSDDPNNTDASQDGPNQHDSTPATESPAPPVADPTDQSSSATPAEEPAPTTAAAPPSAARRSGRPILGAIAGFFLGLFLWVDLVLLGVIGLESVTFWIFPIVFAVAGWTLARWTPFGRRAAPT